MFYCVSEIENLGNVTAVKLGNVFSVATNKSTKAIVHSSKVQKAKCRGPKNYENIGNPKCRTPE